MNQANSLAADSAASFRVRATFAPLTHIELFSFEPERFRQELTDKVRQAPMFFRESPLVISLERLTDPAQEIDFQRLLEICQAEGVKPIAIRGGNPAQLAAARAQQLLTLPAGKQGAIADEPEAAPSIKAAAPEPAAAEVAPAPAVAAAPITRTTKLIEQPVRSGQQIYAADADLIVLAPVSAGAEILADGNIHVYAPLRGRALAGVRGNEQARIFCRSLEAELVSIAGQYKISEDLQNGEWRQSVQIYLRDDHLIVDRFQ